MWHMSAATTALLGVGLAIATVHYVERLWTTNRQGKPGMLNIPIAAGPMCLQHPTLFHLLWCGRLFGNVAATVAVNAYMYWHENADDHETAAAVAHFGLYCVLSLSTVSDIIFWLGIENGAGNFHAVQLAAASAVQALLWGSYAISPGPLAMGLCVMGVVVARASATAGYMHACFEAFVRNYPNEMRVRVTSVAFLVCFLLALIGFRFVDTAWVVAYLAAVQLFGEAYQVVITMTAAWFNWFQERVRERDALRIGGNLLAVDSRTSDRMRATRNKRGKVDSVVHLFDIEKQVPPRAVVRAECPWLRRDPNPAIQSMLSLPETDDRFLYLMDGDSVTPA